MESKNVKKKEKITKTFIYIFGTLLLISFIYLVLAESADPPYVTINSPLNQTYNISSIVFNITALDDDTIDSCWYSLDGDSNITMDSELSNEVNYTGLSFDTAGSGNGYPHGITNDGTYFWITDTISDEVYKYYINGTYTDDSFDTSSSGNSDPQGITNDGTYFWTTDNFDDGVYKFWMNGSYAGEFFDTSGSGNSNPLGITNNNTYFWITDDDDNEVYKYWINGTYTGDHFDTAESTGLFGITNNDMFFWITDNLYDEVYKYWKNAPTGIYTKTSSSMTEGSHTVNFYCNDYYGNLNDTESVSFLVDTLNITLNSTSGYNLTSDNLTAYPQPFNSSQRYVYDWRKQNSTGIYESFALLNIPFDYGTTNSSAIDFTTYNHSIFLGGASASLFPRYNSTFGAIGGSIYFNNSLGDERVTVGAESGEPLSKLGNEVTVSTWVNVETFQDTYFYQEWDDDNEKWQFGFLANGTFRLFDDTDNNNLMFTGNFTFTNNTWYHVVVVGNERNWKGYVDGNLIMDTNSSDGITDMDHNSKHYFGARRYGATADWGYELMGYMDEIMVFNSSLSPEQIKQLYLKRSDSSNSSTTVSQETNVGENWSIQVTSIYEDEMGPVAMSNNLTINPPSIDSIVLNSSLGANTTIENLTAYPINVIPNTSKVIYEWFVNGSSINPLIMPFDGGLLAEDGTKVKDYSGKYNGTVVNAIYNPTGGYDGRGAYYFDGTGDYISTTLDDENVHSVSFWMNPSATDDTDYIMGQRYDAGEESGNWHLDFTALDELMFRYYTASGASSTITSNITFSTGSWYHVVVTTNGSDTHMYVDGSLVANGTGWNTYFGGGDNNDDLMIGRAGGNANWFYYNGYLDEVKLFVNELSLSQVRLIYNGEENVIDSSMTTSGENWSTCGTPNDNINDGIEVCSNNLTVLPTVITSLVLNTTSSYNYSTEDLISWTTVIPSKEDDTKVIYDWQVDRVHYEILVMPFEYGSNDTFTEDYAYNDYTRLRGVVNDNVTYNATGGYDGKGAYEFEGINGGITTAGFLDAEVGLKDDMTFMVWGKYNNLTTDMNLVTYAGPGEGSNENYLYQLELTTNKKLIYMHEYAAGLNEAFTSTVATDVDVGEWHHYAFVRDVSVDTIKFYVDGVKLGDTGTFTNDPEAGEDSNFYLGRDVAGEYWNGTLDDVYIYDMVYTQGQIKNYYQNRSYILDKTMTSVDDVWKICGIPINNEFGVGNYVCSNELTIQEGPPAFENVSVKVEVDNITFNASIYNEDDIDKVWIKIWDNIIDGTVKFFGYLTEIISGVWQIVVPINSSFNKSEYNYTIYSNTTTGLETNFSSTFNITYIGVDSVILNSTNGTSTTYENLTAYAINITPGAKAIYDWRMNGNSIAVLNMPFEGGSNSSWTKDYTDNANDGTVIGATYNSTGGRNGYGAYEFDGVNDAINIDYNQNFNFTGGDGFTVMAWVKPNTLVDNRGNIISQYLATDDNRVWDLQVYNGQARFVGCYDGTIGSCIYAYSGILVNDSNTWYHLVGTWNGTELQIYVDGVAEDPSPPALANIYSTDVTDIRIGRHTSSEWYNGTIDEVMIFNRSLSPKQISAIYNNRTDLIVSNETSLGEIWQSCVTPTNALEDGTEVCSNNLTIRTEDTCICPSSPAVWNVNMEDNCWLNNVCNISGYDLTFYGVGNFTVNATLYVNELLNLSLGMTVWMKPNGLIYNGAN